MPFAALLFGYLLDHRSNCLDRVIQEDWIEVLAPGPRNPWRHRSLPLDLDAEHGFAGLQHLANKRLQLVSESGNDLSRRSMDVLLDRNAIDLCQPLVHPDEAQISGEHREPDRCGAVQRFQLRELLASELLAVSECSLIVVLLRHIADNGDPVSGLAGVAADAGHMPLGEELASGASVIDHF